MRLILTLFAGRLAAGILSIELVASLDRSQLVIKEDIAELGRDSELGQSSASLLRQVISHLNVDVVRMDGNLASPALVDDLDEFGRKIPRHQTLLHFSPTKKPRAGLLGLTERQKDSASLLLIVKAKQHSPHPNAATSWRMEDYAWNF